MSDKFVFLYHGVFTRERGILECLKAIMFLKKEYPDMVLFLLGTLASYGSVGYEEVPKYIAMSDVGIVPLPNIRIWRYQCPLKLLEYLSMKRTVIATDIHANREILGDEECAIYVPSCDYILISKAMEYAYKNKGKLREWGESGRKIITEKYNWCKAAEDLEKYLFETKDRTKF